MFGAFADSRVSDEEELPEMTASNAFELFDITDPIKQQEIYHAYVRLFGDDGYEGRTAEECWVKARMKLMKDGSMQMAIVDDTYGDKDNIEWFDPIEYAKSNERGVDYFRRTQFDPNMSDLRERLEREIAANERVKKQLALATGGECPLKVDEGLY